MGLNKICLFVFGIACSKLDNVMAMDHFGILS